MNRVSLLTTLGVGTLSGLCVAIGLLFASVVQPPAESEPLINSVMRFDAIHYTEIVEQGYSYDPEKRSTVAFFPVYPLLSKSIALLTGFSVPLSMMLVSNAMQLVSLLLFGEYLRATAKELPGRRTTSQDALLCFAYFPTTFFFRMPYSESTFLVFCLSAFVGMSQKWHPLYIAFVIGLATGSRPVGVALLAPFACHLLKSSTSNLQRAQQLSILPVAAWGLLAYMTYQYFEFGDAFCFVQTQQHWARHEDISLADRALSLATLEPIWSVYLPDSSYSWHSDRSPLFSLEFMNPIFFIFCVGCVAVGAIRRYLTAEEYVFAAAVLLIPYVTRGYEWGMLSHGRFSAVAFPMYIVLAKLLAIFPRSLTPTLIVICGVLLACYTALFSLGRPFF